MNPTEPAIQKEAPPPIAEGELAARLGVSRDDLKKLRTRLEPGSDWLGGAGRPVLITTSGQAKLVTLLADLAQKKGAGALQEAASGADAVNPYITLTVTRIGSPRVLLAKDEAGNVFRLQVRTSEHFRVGMELERCAPCPHTNDVAYYHGRYPRRRWRF